MKQDAGKVGTVQAHVQFLLLFHRIFYQVLSTGSAVHKATCAQPVELVWFDNLVAMAPKTQLPRFNAIQIQPLYTRSFDQVPS